MHHVRALRVVDVAERGVSVVRWPAVHGVRAIDLAREEHAVAVEGQEGVVDLGEGLEVGRPADADGVVVSVGAVAPADPVAAFEPSPSLKLNPNPSRL